MERRDAAAEKMLGWVPRVVRGVVGGESGEQRVRWLHEMLQYPLLNKHLFYILFDEVVVELFPELRTSTTEAKKQGDKTKE